MPIETIQEFFTRNPLGRFSVEEKYLRGAERFQTWLPKDGNNIWPCALAYFAINALLTYWDDEVVEQALSILERDTERTKEALGYRETDVNNGFDNLLRSAQNGVNEESFDLSHTADLLRLATETNPQYLQIAHHIFGNFLGLYWSLVKSGKTNGKFNFPGAVALFKSRNVELLIGGYDDKIRNAIAHGQVYIRGLGIQYGEPKYHYELSQYEFSDKFDLLWRTSVSLAVAIILFYSRNTNILDMEYPLWTTRLLASSIVERDEFKIKDTLVSELRATGKQLHVLLETPNFSRSAIILDCIHFAVRMAEYGRDIYSRILFDVNYSKKTIPGLLTIKFSRLKELLELDAPFNRVSEVLEHNLLWYDESFRLLMLKTLFRNLPKNIRHLYWKSVKERKGKFKSLASGSYRIKKIMNSSAGGLARIDIRAVLTNPNDAVSKEQIRAVVKDIIKKQSLRWTSTNSSQLIRRWSLPALPSYIWIQLYRKDGALRWLNNSGWLGGNLICAAEFIRGRRPPLSVKWPDIVEKGIRYQFSMKLPPLRESKKSDESSTV